MPPSSTIILGTRVDALSWEQAVSRILRWAQLRSSRYVCLCNVHTVVSAGHDPGLQAALEAADMATADGAPIAWLMRRRGWADQQRINGPDLMWRTLAEAERLQIPVFFYGSSTATLTRLDTVVRHTFPALLVAGQLSPPFRALSPEEDAVDCATINDSGARLVLIGLGCPKQEKWMTSHRGRIHAVMLGVGAAFDYHAGTIRRAPASWQRLGLEWLYRLGSEPARLMKRYLLTNTLFILALPRELRKRPRV